MATGKHWPLRIDFVKKMTRIEIERRQWREIEQWRDDGLTLIMCDCDEIIWIL